MAEVKQVTWGGWKAGIFFLKLAALLHSFLHHLAVAVVDSSDDDITQALFLVRETHPALIRLSQAPPSFHRLLAVLILCRAG